MAQPTGGGLELSDLIAGLALVASLGSWWWSSHVEKRIRKQSDSRFDFDQTIVAPVSAKLEILDQVLLRLVAASAIIDPAQRTSKLSEIQTHDHTVWFFSMTALADRLEGSEIEMINSGTHDYWDNMAECVNKLSVDLPSDEQSQLAAKVAQIGEVYLMMVRQTLQKVRARL